MPEPKLDLQGLAIERGRDVDSDRPPRHALTRYVLPAAVLLGFAALMLTAAGEQFLPRQAVSVVPVVVKRMDVQEVGTPLFQAAGWIEPRPTPMNVAALAPGVVEELLVVEGQDVSAGEPIARLIDIDAELALRRAEAARDLREAEKQQAEATLEGARLRYENPAHLKAVLAEAKSELAQTRTEIAGLPYLIRSAEARAGYAKQNLARKRAAGKAVAARTVDQAESEHAEALADLEELQQRGPRLREEAEALTEKVEAVSRQLELLIEESRQLGEARAALKIAEARLAEAKLAAEAAQLDLERTVVKAPVGGRILEIIAHPGSRVMGLDAKAGQSASTVVSMYDPARLQVRADVRLEDVPLVSAGQRVEIEIRSSERTLTGTVLLSTSSANIQKNTLEVKVAIDDPPDWVRPEMLVDTTFLAPPTESKEKKGSPSRQRLLVPKELVEETEQGAYVWIVTPDQRALRRNVTLGRAENEELIEVTSGLNPTDKLISSGTGVLEPGARLAIASANG